MRPKTKMSKYWSGGGGGGERARPYSFGAYHMSSVTLKLSSGDDLVGARKRRKLASNAEKRKSFMAAFNRLKLISNAQMPKSKQEEDEEMIDSLVDLLVGVLSGHHPELKLSPEVIAKIKAVDWGIDVQTCQRR
jgi:hypothetical protein